MSMKYHRSNGVLLLVFICGIMFPLLGFAAGVTGTLNGYSIKGKSLVVDGIEYSADIEKLNITYNGEYTGADALEAGLEVELILNDKAAGTRGGNVVRMKILSHKPELES